MNNKHTKGKWKQEGDHIVGERYICTLDTWAITGQETKYPEENQKLEDEKQANANLIAAAPDLLEACKEVYQSMNTTRATSKQVRVSMHSIRKVYRAIQKAKGEL